MPDVIDNEMAAREVTRWRGKPVLISIVIFFASLILVLVLCGAITGAWTGGRFPERAADGGAPADPAWNHAPPQLQTRAAADLATLRAQEFQHLHTVRWADATRTFATMPIDDAMALYAQAASAGQTGQLLPPPKPATPIDLQVQKSNELTPPAQPPEKP